MVKSCGYAGCINLSRLPLTLLFYLHVSHLVCQADSFQRQEPRIMNSQSFSSLTLLSVCVSAYASVCVVKVYAFVSEI